MSPETRCVNIGPAGIRARRAAGIFAALFGVALVILMIVLHVPRAMRLVAFAPFWLSALGFLQALEKT